MVRLSITHSGWAHCALPVRLISRTHLARSSRCALVRYLGSVPGLLLDHGIGHLPLVEQAVELGVDLGHPVGADVQHTLASLGDEALLDLGAGSAHGHPR